MAPTDTVIETKSAFLRSQVRLLSNPLTPPRNWQDRAPASEDGDLREKVVAEVLYKLNTLHRRHTKSAYSSQPLRHVAEQIDRLYWEAGAPHQPSNVSSLEVLNKGSDYTEDTPSVISALPEEWSVDDTGSQQELEAYTTLQNRLTQLSAQRQSQRQKLAQYRHLQELLRPFENPHENIQPNLVTRDGELGGELDRMRMLMARVGSRIGGLEGSEAEDGKDGRTKEDQGMKLEQILNGNI
ncbi:MAG: hypothetical protein M1812_007848 [Candelaria pacifica]|nr:MAG: hypothetical protein M1812_007848 [Candelaria pacifica]